MMRTRIALASFAIAAAAFDHASSARADPPVLLRHNVVAAAIQRAITRAGLDPSVTRGLATRARASGWLPHFSVRVARGMGSLAAESYQAATMTDRMSSSDSLALDLRMQLQLDRVVFHPSEVAIERVEIRRAEQRDALEREVIEQLATMERSAAELRAADDGSATAIRLEIDYARARARIEALTGVSLEELLHAR